MTQEKQKVIRVLQPTKKTTKVSPKYLGISAVAIGVLATSALLFTFLKSDNDGTQAIETSQHADSSVINEKNLSNNHKDESNKPEIHASLKTAEDDNEKSLDHEDDFNKNQPKPNELTNIFKHKKEAQPVVVEKQPTSSNPFDNAFGQAKVDKPIIVTNPNTKLTMKPNSTTSIIPKAPDKLILVKKPTELQKPTTPVASKNAPKEKEPDFEVPHTSVQIAITRSVKE